MQYNSVAEYFVRLQNRSLIFSLLAVLVFSTLVYLMIVKILTPVMVDGQGLLIGGIICLLSFIEIITSFFLTGVMLKKVRVIESLGERLDRYATVNLIRFALLLCGCLMLTAAFYISGHPWIPIAYVVYLLFILIAWPSRSRVCGELKLKPSEREVIYER